jgi:hypothetical protein
VRALRAEPIREPSARLGSGQNGPDAASAEARARAEPSPPSPPPSTWPSPSPSAVRTRSRASGRGTRGTQNVRAATAFTTARSRRVRLWRPAPHRSAERWFAAIHPNPGPH